ncbi:glycoside hydrolase superfamily [Phakopsora pachyrhizi]|uniref:Beta-mannosidase A n=1 Tax=Phakopsora pachyrhizi TaxID=170000 RepID=A0AAV0ADI0_PHAPC|nr:glycoside hydrolase superfamily [Phakopsora pachyrhizi]
MALKLFYLFPIAVAICFVPLFVPVGADPKRGPPILSSQVSLSSFPWKLYNNNRSIALTTPFINQAHLALIDAGIIDEPNIGLNEAAVRWVGEEKSWTWETELKVPDEPSWEKVDRLYLAFEGLDTFCEIKVGDRVVGSTDNAFRSWVFDVTDAVRQATSQPIHLYLKFASALDEVSRQAHTSGNHWYPPGQGNLKTTLQVFEYNYRNWARKQQSDFGWDWGPAYLPSGPTKPGYLLGLSLPDDESKIISDSKRTREFKSSSKKETSKSASSSHLRNFHQKRQKPHSDSNKPPLFWIQRTVIDVYRKGQRNNRNPDQSAAWILNVTLPIVSTASFDNNELRLSGKISGTQVTLPSTPLAVTQPPDYMSSGPNTFLTAAFTIKAEDVQLWYPVALGEPKLYDLELTLTASDNGPSKDSSNKASETTAMTWYEKIGFRTIVVDQSRYSDLEVSRGVTPGTRFTFVINGKPFYVQGNSMIPIDVFSARTNSSTLRWLFESSILAHQNVIRIWGGGAYQTDEFYDMCDEMGLLAWSENVFACGGYPISPRSFLDNIKAEVAENVARLNRHPSIALWAGNNEGEGYLIAVNQTRPNGTIYFNEYDYLYNHVIRDVLLENTRSLSYLPSSTTQGYFTLDPYVSRYYNSTPGEIYGDQENYNYDTSRSFNVATYPVARFVNEFGFHSMPSIYTWDRVLKSPQDYDFNSSVIRAHNKHNPEGPLKYPFGADDSQGQLTTGVTRWYPTPNMTGNSRDLLAQWAYSTQVFQAAFMAAEISYYRLGASRGENNMGECYCAIIVNDIWEGISWSSIEYTGRWKIFHYTAERVQDRVIISPIYHQTNQTLDIYVTSDLWVPVEGIAQWTWYDFAGKSLSSTTASFRVGPINSTRLLRSQGLDSIVPAKQSPNDAWLHLQMRTRDGKYINEQFYTPVPLKDANLRATKVISKPIGPRKVSIEVLKGGVAPWVNVEHPPGLRGYFKDIKTGKPSNAFYLRPQEKRQLEFVLADKDHGSNNDEKLEEKIVVRTLLDNIAS